MLTSVRRIVVDNDWGVLGVLLVFFAGAVVGSRTWPQRVNEADEI